LVRSTFTPLATAVRLLPFTAKVAGNESALVMPLMVKLPLTVSLPAAAGVTLVITKLAVGNFSTPKKIVGF